MILPVIPDRRHGTCLQIADRSSHGRNIPFNLQSPSAQSWESWVVVSGGHISAPYKEELSTVRVI